MNKTAMSITFTPISLEEMDKFIRRAFRAMEPKAVNHRGEVAYDLRFEDDSKVVVRVYTAIDSHGGDSAEKGADAIRIGLFSVSGRPLKSGKLPIVKRTQNWRDNLRERIEDEIEDYHDRQGYWESRA